MVDIHCHILPGVDDGPATLDDSLAMLRVAQRDGIRTIVATPHFGGRFPEPEPATIRTLVERVNERAATEGLAITVLPGCEAHLGLDLPAKVEAERAVVFGSGPRYLLVEVEAEPLPLYALDVSFQLRVMGVQPILAHAERLALTRTGLAFVRRFAEQGGLVQVNADAVGGQAGWHVNGVCRRLLKEGLVHVIASDGHSATRRPPILSVCLRGFPKSERPVVAERYCNLPGVA